MHKRMLSLLLAACMLLPLVPVMAMPAVAAEGALLSSSFMADRQVSVTADPMTYAAWAEKNGKADVMADAATQALYESYFYEHGQVVWSGDWMTGGIHRTTGVFEPIAYHTQFAGCTWSAWKGDTWYSTKSTAEFLLDGYFQSGGAEFNKLWGNENVPFHVSIKTTNQARFSKTNVAYFSYAYTVPENVAGTVSLSMLSANTKVNTTTHVMIMLNDEIVWPSGATLSNVATWKTGLYNGPHLNAALGGLALEVEAGDQIHFVVTDDSTKTVQLDPCVTISSERTWRPTSSTYAGKLGLPIDEDAFAAFCAQALDPNAESSKQAYLDYVLNHTERAWVGNWSAGSGIVKNNVFVYEPLAYTDYYNGKTWSDTLSIGNSGFLLTKSQYEQFLGNIYLMRTKSPACGGEATRCMAALPPRATAVCRSGF